jgi:uncharacterized protein
MMKKIAFAVACAFGTLATTSVMAQAAAPAAATSTASPAKKELVQKLLVLQQPGIEGVARSIVERPASQLMQAAGQALQAQVPPEKREAIGKSIEADVKKFVEDSVPVLRDRAVKLAPTVIGPVMEEKFTEDELKALIAWLDSPVNKKYQQMAPELQNTFAQKLIAEAGPLLDTKLQTLQAKVRNTLGAPPAGAASDAKPAAKPSAKPAPAAK